MNSHLLLTVCSFSLFTLHIARGMDQDTYTFYRDYSAPVPTTNYVVFDARAFVPDNYVILDLQQKRAMVYSPFQRKGLLYTHEMTNVEYERAMSLLTSNQVRKIPERNGRTAFDAFEFGAHGTIGGTTLKFHHVLPDNEAVLQLYDLYKHFRDTIPKEHSNKPIQRAP